MEKLFCQFICHSSKDSTYHVRSNNPKIRRRRRECLNVKTPCTTKTYSNYLKLSTTAVAWHPVAGLPLS